MRKFLPILILLSLSAPVLAQFDPQYSHYMWANTSFNPAFTGVKGEICANLISHNQNIGFDGAPFTNLICVDSPVNLFGISSGIGLTIVNDIFGFFNNFVGKGAYSYHFNPGIGDFSVGTEFGLTNVAIDADWTYPDVDEQLDQQARKMLFDIGAGIYYELEDFYLGFSSSHLLRPNFKLESTESATSDSSKVSIFFRNHYFLTGGYNIQLANSLIDLTPSFLVKSDGVKTQYDINVILLYNKKFWGGVTYRNRDAVIFFAGTSIYNNLKIGLAYDVTISRLNKASNGTFEVYVGYCFSFVRVADIQRYSSVKFLGNIK